MNGSSRSGCTMRTSYTLVFATTMNVRQVLSVPTSYAMYGHAITSLQVLGLLVAFGGVLCDRISGLFDCASTPHGREWQLVLGWLMRQSPFLLTRQSCCQLRLLSSTMRGRQAKRWSSSKSRRRNLLICIRRLSMGTNTL